MSSRALRQAIAAGHAPPKYCHERSPQAPNSRRIIMVAAPERTSGHRMAAVLRIAAVSALAMMIALPMVSAQPEGRNVNQPGQQVPNELLMKVAAGVSRGQAQEIVQRAGGQIIGDPVLDGRLFHIRVTDAGSLAMVKAALERASGVEYVETVPVVSIPPTPNR
jgi:hypothetical protein